VGHFLLCQVGSKPSTTPSPQLRCSARVCHDHHPDCARPGLLSLYPLSDPFHVVRGVRQDRPLIAPLCDHTWHSNPFFSFFDVTSFNEPLFSHHCPFRFPCVPTRSARYHCYHGAAWLFDSHFWCTAHPSGTSLPLTAAISGFCSWETCCSQCFSHNAAARCLPCVGPPLLFFYFPFSAFLAPPALKSTVSFPPIDGRSTKCDFTVRHRSSYAWPRLLRRYGRYSFLSVY